MLPIPVLFQLLSSSLLECDNEQTEPSCQLSDSRTCTHVSFTCTYQFDNWEFDEAQHQIRVGNKLLLWIKIFTLFFYIPPVICFMHVENISSDHYLTIYRLWVVADQFMKFLMSLDLTSAPSVLPVWLFLTTKDRNLSYCSLLPLLILQALFAEDTLNKCVYTSFYRSIKQSPVDIIPQKQSTCSQFYLYSIFYMKKTL